MGRLDALGSLAPYLFGPLAAPWTGGSAVWNPFRRRVETRANYTDSLTSLLLREASGSGAPTGQAHATAAVEACAALWSHAFAGARLEPAVPALSAFTLATMARSLILDGESLHVIEVERGELKLLPASDFDVTGSSPDPTTWTYRVDLHGPNDSITRTIPAEGIVHIRYSIDPSRPWRGIGPLSRSSLDASLLSAVLTRLGEEASAHVANVIPSPVDGAAASTEQLRADLKAARGGLVLVESMASGYGDRASAPLQDWSVRRIGANPPAVLPALAEATGHRLMEACGVPSALLIGSADGTAQREALRRWVHCHVAPLGRIVAAELADKLDLPGLSMGFEALYGSDIVGRASAAKRMVEAGMPASEAFALSGLVSSDE